MMMFPLMALQHIKQINSHFLFHQSMTTQLEGVMERITFHIQHHLVLVKLLMFMQQAMEEIMVVLLQL